MTRTTTIILILLSTLFTCAASAEEMAYTCNYQLGSEAEATRRKIGSAIIAINVTAKTARVDFGKGWFKTMTLLVDGTDVKETSPPASGDELGFFYFDLAANSGGFSGGGKNREFFDSCVRTKISDIVAQSNRAAGAPRRSEPIPGQTASPSTQKAEPNSEPKLAAKPEPNEAAPPSALSASPDMLSAPAAPAEAKTGEKGHKDLAANTPSPLPTPDSTSAPAKSTAEALSSSPQSLAAAPPPSAQQTTGDEHDAINAAKASEPPPEPRSAELPKGAPEPEPTPPPSSVPASPPADVHGTTDYYGSISDSAKTPPAQPEPSATVEPPKNAPDPTPAAPPSNASAAAADAAQAPAASTGKQEKLSPAAPSPPTVPTEPAVTVQSAAANPGGSGAENKPSPLAAPAVAATSAVEACRETLDSETHTAAITFANASAILSNDSVAELRKIAEIARSCTNVAIEVGGHTDTFGTRLGNRELSQRRADAVVGVLVSEGVPAEKLRAIGYGQDQPIASNATAAGRRMNRRVEFHITPVKTSG